MMRRLQEGKIIAAAERMTLADMNGEQITSNVIIAREYWGWREEGDWFASGDLDVTTAPEITSAGERVLSLGAWRCGTREAWGHEPFNRPVPRESGLDPEGFPRAAEAKPDDGGRAHGGRVGGRREHIARDAAKIAAADFATWHRPVAALRQ